MENLLDYFNTLTKDGRRAFCEDCGTSENYIRKACSKGQKMDAALCVRIERHSRRLVRCEHLRPDVDWAYIRGTRKPKRVAA